MKRDLKKLMTDLHYRFKNKSLLERALSHRSYGKKHNELLEFLGDAILNFVVAAELFQRFPDGKEGQLSRLRSHLVKGEALADLARNFHLSSYLFLGVGEIKSGGAYRQSILSDTVEAIIGAIYLDSNINSCHKVIVSWLEEILNDLSLSDVKKDPKSLLQEIVQSKQQTLPQYNLASVKGEEHAQKFVIECAVSLLDKPICGEGNSRRKAEQDAASKVLKALKHGK